MSALPTQDLDLDDDDRPIGRLLSRREVLVVTGGLGAAFRAGTPAAPCTSTSRCGRHLLPRVALSSRPSSSSTRHKAQAVYANLPYAAHGASPDTPNASDGIYNQTGGQTLLTVAPAGAGYAASIGIGIQA